MALLPYSLMLVSLSLLTLEVTKELIGGHLRSFDLGL